MRKENLFVLCLLLNDWNYFLNKYCNLPFLAKCHFLLPLLIFLASPWYQKAKIELAKLKKWLIVILKDFIKQPVIKQTPTLLSFTFLIDYCISVFSSLLNRVLGVLACSRAWRVCVLGMLDVLACLAYFCARVLGVLLYSCALLTCLLWCVFGVLSIGILTFLSNYLFCLHKSKLCN